MALRYANDKKQRISYREQIEDQKFGYNLSSYLENLNNEYSNLYNSYNSRFFDKDGNFVEAYGRDDSDIENKKYVQSHSKLKSDITKVEEYLSKYADKYDSNTLNKLTSFLTTAKDGLSKMGSAYQFYSDFHTEYDYNGYLMNNTEGYENDNIGARQNAYKANSSRISELDDLIKNFKYENEGSWEWNMSPDSNIPMPTYTIKAKNQADIDALIEEKRKLEAENRKYEHGNKTTDEKLLQYKGNEDYVTDSQKRDGFLAPSPEDMHVYKTDVGWYYVGRDELLRYNNESHATGVGKDYKGNEVTYSVDDLAIEDPLGTFFKAVNASKYDIIPDTSASKGRNDVIYNYEQVIADGVHNSWKQLKDEEIGLYYYFLNNNMRDEALAYLEGITPELNRRENQESAEYLANEATPLEMVFYNVASVPASVFGGAMSFVSDVSSLATGKDINPYDSAHSMQNFAQNVRGATASDIEEWTNNAEFLNVSYGDAYQSVMSGIDSILGAMTFGSGYTVLMGMGSASSKAKELYEKGASNTEIALGGLLSGTAEMVFEKISIDYFLDNFINSRTTWKNFIPKLLTQGGIELSEETATELSNIISDAIVMGSQSDWKQAINMYKDLGYSDSEAMTKALWKIGGNVLEAGIGGFISGAFMGGGGSLINLALNKNAENTATKETGAKIITNENLQNLVATAENLPDTPANAKIKAIANEVKGIDVSKLSEKEKAALSKKVGKLYSGIQSTQRSMVQTSGRDTVTNIISEKLKENGITNEADIKKATEAIIKTVYGDKQLSASEAQIMDKVDGKKIANYLLNNEKEILAKANIAHSQRWGQAVETASLTKDKDAKVRTIDIDDYTFSDNGETYIKGTDEVVTVTGINSIKDGKMKVNLSNGKTASLSELDLGSEDQAIIYEGVLGMGIDAAHAQDIVKAFAAAAENGLSAKNYILGMQDAVRYGKIGGKAFIDTGVFTSMLSESHRKMGYNIGAITAVNSAKKDAERVNTSIKMNKKGDIKAGKVSYDGISEKDLNIQQKTTVKILEQLFGGRGVNIVFFQSPTNEKGKHIGESGSFNTKTNTIRLDINAGIQGEDTILFTASHELTHFIRLWSPEKFKVFADFLIDNYAKHGVSIDALIDKQIAKAESNNRTIDRDAAYEEVIADSCETFLRDSKLFDKLLDLAKKDMTLFEKTQLYISNLLADIRKVYNGLKPDSPEGKIVLSWKDSIEQLHALWEEAALSALDNSQAAGGKIQKTTTSEGDVKMQIREDFYTQLDNWDGQTVGFSFVIGKTSDALKQAKIPDKQIRWDASKIKTLLDKHNGMTIDTIREIPELLENPVVVIDSKQDKNSKIVMGELHDNNGKLVTVVLLLTPTSKKGNQLDVIKVSSAQGRGHIESLFKNEDGSKVPVRYVDKKRIQNWLNVNRLQLPLHSFNLDSDNSIPQTSKKSQEKLSDRENDIDIDTQINQSMTMDEVKQMIQRAFVLGEIQEWYDGEYKNGDEWLRAQGADEVAMYIENEYTLQEKYINKIQGIINDEFYVADVLEAYLKGTLVGKEKPKAKRLDVSVNHRINDTRFYSPQRIENVKELFDVASQKLTSKNRAEVSGARAKILLFAHNKGASELLGLSQSELNKKLRSWSGYTAGAREISEKLNKGVADSNKWTGIENCSWLYKSQVTTEELESLVKSVEGAASDYEKLYIARTMLALDTHIDWSWLSIEFDTKDGVNKKYNGSGRCNGFYRNDSRKIVSSHNSPDTIAHEMGHALDYQWGRDLGFSRSALTDVYRNTKQITDADTKQFFDNFKIFLDSLTDNGDIRSEYTQDPKEVFARFIARFIQWVDNTGTGHQNYNYEYSAYKDTFTASHYIEFVKLLQEKAMLDSKKVAEGEDVKFSDRDSTYMEAVNNGDMETAQRLVNEVAKANGYNSPMLYHGTPTGFGFTVFDASKVDDKLSFFATNDERIAKTYSGETNRKNISDRITIDVDNASPAELLELLQKHIDENYRLVGKAELEKIKAPLYETIRNSSNVAREFILENSGTFNDEKRRVAYRIVNSISAMADAETESELDGARASYQDATWELRAIDQSIAYELLDAIDTTKLFRAVDDIDMYSNSEALFTNGTKTINDNSAWTILSSTLYTGVYSLYGNTDGMLEIDANGANWNRINTNSIQGAKHYVTVEDGYDSTDVPKMMSFNDAQTMAYNMAKSKYGEDVKIHTQDIRDDMGYPSSAAFRVVVDGMIGEKILVLNQSLQMYTNTRGLARYAKDAGYNGVRISNLKDSGGAIQYNAPSDVYVFFNNTQMKSADPVTYDDNGNVIPLSERFNAANEDIRYSDRDYVITDNRAAFTEEHIKGLYEDYSVSSTSDMMKDYAQAYVAYINPSDFLSLTSLNGEKIRNEAVELDLEKLQAKDDRELPYLEIDEESGEVYEHDGRHRLIAFENAGIEQVAIRLLPVSQENKYHRKTIDINLKGQEFNWRNEKGEIVSGKAKGNVTVTAHPLSPSNRPVIEKLFGEGKMLYSDRDPDAAENIKKINDQLAKENVKLIEDVRYLKELVKLQGKETHGKMLKKSTVELVAKRLMAYSSAKGNTSELVSYLTDVYNYIAQGEDVSWEGIQEKSQAAVDWLMQNESHKPVRDEYADSILKELRTMRVSLDDTQKKEVAYYYGSFNNFRKKNMGRIIITNDGIPLDSAWQELAEMHPAYFDKETNSADQPIILMDIIDGLQNSYAEDEYHYYSEEMIAQDLMTKVYEGYWDVSALHTVADAKQKEINLLKAKHKERMDALRKTHSDNEAKLRQEHKDRVSELRTQYREREENKIKKVAEYYQKSRKEAVDRVKESREKRDAITKLQRLVLDTAKWVSYPAKTDVKCPDIIRGPYAEFLSSIDLSSKRLLNGGEPTQNDLRVASAMDSLAKAIEKKLGTQSPDTETETVLDTGYLDLPVHFVDNLKELSEELKKRMASDGHIVNSMTSEEIKTLTKFIKTLNHSIKEMSTLYSNMRFAKVEQLGSDTMLFLKDLGETKQSKAIVNFVTWDNALPYYTFKRFGVGGESVFEELMDAQDKLAYLADQIFKFKEKTWTDKEASEWSKDTHTIKLPSGRELTLTSSDAMSIYCLSRREQGKQHLLGGGVRVLGIEKNGKKTNDSRSLLNQQDILAIASSLTERQKQVAEAIQEYMSTVCAEWGNEISMKRFLTKEFTENYYFPIESNDENLDTKDPKAQQSDLYRLLNISATKPLTKGANNEVIIRNVFDVFTGHSSDMARLNAYGMALLDYMKWINYRVKTMNDEGQISVSGVRKSMEKAYGPEAKKYVIGLIKDINGRANDGGDHPFLMKMTRTAKTAMVGANLRVSLLQFTAYPRAAMVLSNKSLALGLTKVPQIEKAKKYCGIALWKSFGFYDTNISRSIEDQIKGATNIRQKIIELSLKGAEWGDAITWGCLWNACEYEVAKTNQYKVGSEEFNEAVGKKLREVVYATQVVDSTLTRSQMMRNKSGLTQSASAFMSEPTLSANILMDAGFQFNLEKRRTGSSKLAWQKTSKYIGKAVAVYSIGQIFAALAEALMDAYRDDDDEEFKKKFGEAFKENVISDLNPFNKIPLISEVSDLILSCFGIGFSSSNSLYLQAFNEASNAFETWKKVINGEDGKTVYAGIYSTTKVLSYITGVSASGAMREVVTLWNNTAGAADPYLKIRTYESSATDKGIAEYKFDKGDTTSVKTTVSKMIEEKVKSGKTEKEAKSAVRSSFTSTYKSEYMEAAKNKDFEEMNRIRKFLYATGLYGTLSELDETLKKWRTSK